MGRLNLLTRVSSTMSRSTIESLPNEMLLKIFKLLRVSQLKRVNLVCYRWNLVTQDPQLWTSGCLAINYKTVDRAQEILCAGGRFCLMNKLKFYAWCVPAASTEMVLKLLSSQEKITELVLRGNALWLVDQTMLSTCLNKMLVVQLTKVCLAPPQVRLMFEEMEEKKNLVELEIRDNDLYWVPDSLFSRCVNRMERVSLVKCNLSYTQVRALLLDMHKGTCLKELDIRRNEQCLFNRDLSELCKLCKELNVVLHK